MATRTRPMSKGQRLLARVQNAQMQATTEDLTQELQAERVISKGATVITEHQQMPLVTLYRPMVYGDGRKGDEPGYRQDVPSTNVPALLEAGWTPDCPHCGSDQCEGAPMHCPSFESPKFAVCQVCGKVIPAVRSDGDVVTEAQLRAVELGLDTSRLVQFEAPADDESLLRERVARHMRAFHPEEAPAYGYGPVDPRATSFQPDPRLSNLEAF